MTPSRSPASIALATAILCTTVLGQSEQSASNSFYRGLLAELIDHDFHRARNEYERAAKDPANASRELALARLIELDRLQMNMKDGLRHGKMLREITKLEPPKERRSRSSALRSKIAAELAKKPAAEPAEILKLRKKLAGTNHSPRSVVYRVVRQLDDKANSAQRPAPVKRQLYSNRVRSMRRMAAVVANRHLSGKHKSARELAQVLRRSTGRWLTSPHLPKDAPAKKLVRKSVKAMESYLKDRSMPVYERHVVAELLRRVQSLAAAKNHKEALELLLQLPYYDRKFLRS